MANRDELRARLRIPQARLDDINALLLDPDLRVVNDLLDVVAKYGTPEEINAQGRQGARPRQPDDPAGRARLLLPGRPDLAAEAARRGRVRQRGGVPPAGAGRRRPRRLTFKDDFAVTLEISAAQYFPWLIAEARQSIEKRELMPGRFIRVRKMRESEADCGDMLALAAAMQIMGASYVETLDTKGTDGSNIHLGGPDTITGLLRRRRPAERSRAQVGGRVPLLLHHLRHAAGAEHQPRHGPGRLPAATSWASRTSSRSACSWATTTRIARAVDADRRQALLARRRHLPADRLQLEQLGQQRDHRDHGAVPQGAGLRGGGALRAPHHRGLPPHRDPAVQPPRRAGGSWPTTCPTSRPSTRAATRTSRSTRAHSSSILDYFRAKEEIEAAGEMDALLQNYLDKHESVNRTARALTEHGLSLIAAPKLHHRK